MIHSFKSWARWLGNAVKVWFSRYVTYLQVVLIVYYILLITQQVVRNNHLEDQIRQVAALLKQVDQLLKENQRTDPATYKPI